MKHSIIAISLMMPLSALAQVAEDPGAPLLYEGANFFASIVAGVLLAIGFQLLLTALSVAAGITAIGDIKEKGNKKDDVSHDHNYDDDDDDGMNMGQKISTGFGVWTMITTSIALFFASLLAVQLGLVGADFVGAALGLVIWAAFFTLMTYLEINAISSLVGGLIGTVKNGLSSASSVFSKSDTGAAKEVARTNAKAQSKEMRKQFEKLFDTNDIDKKIDDYVDQLKPQRIDINNLKKQIKDLLTDLQVKEKADFDYPNSVKKMILEEADKSTLSKEQKEAVKEHVSGLKDIAQSDASNEEKAKKGVEELTPADREQIDQYQQKIKKALQNTNKKELQPEKLEEDIKRIMNEPGQASNIAKAKASALDRQTLMKIASSQGMSEDEASKYADKVEGVLKKVSSFLGSSGSQASSQKDSIQAKVKEMFSGGGGGGSSFSPEKIYSDFTSIFQSSGEGSDLQYKLQHYDKAQMTALVSRRTGMSRSESESIAENIVSARDGVLEKANQVQTKVNEKMREAREKSLAAAEESRKTAATAAWWLVGTAILSAVASAVGGMVALESWFF